MCCVGLNNYGLFSDKHNEIFSLNNALLFSEFSIPHKYLLKYAAFVAVRKGQAFVLCKTTVLLLFLLRCL